MKIYDRIREAETKFLDNNIDEPRFLILTPGSYTELLNYLAEYEEDYLVPLYGYEGLIIAVTHNPRIHDFEIS